VATLSNSHLYALRLLMEKENRIDVDLNVKERYTEKNDELLT
jgi:hypothetical protein